MRLLLLEDDTTLGRACATTCSAMATGSTGAPLWRRRVRWLGNPYDAWLLDWNLPDGSGVDWLRSLRARGQMTGPGADRA